MTASLHGVAQGEYPKEHKYPKGIKASLPQAPLRTRQLSITESLDSDQADPKENIRRIAEVDKLMLEAGDITKKGIISFASLADNNYPFG